MAVSYGREDACPLECSQGVGPSSCVERLRLVYKPHSVQRAAQVYARRLHPWVRLSDHLSMQSTRDLPFPEGSGRSGPLHRLCLTLLSTGVAWPSALLRTPVV